MIQKLITKKSIVGLNGELIKEGTIIELTKLSYTEQGFWMNRYKDSKIDHCVEVFKQEKTTKKGDK